MFNNFFKEREEIETQLSCPSHALTQKDYIIVLLSAYIHFAFLETYFFSLNIIYENFIWIPFPCFFT